MGSTLRLSSRGWLGSVDDRSLACGIPPEVSRHPAETLAGSSRANSTCLCPSIPLSSQGALRGSSRSCSAVYRDAPTWAQTTMTVPVTKKLVLQQPSGSIEEIMQTQPRRTLTLIAGSRQSHAGTPLAQENAPNPAIVVISGRATSAPNTTTPYTRRTHTSKYRVPATSKSPCPCFSCRFLYPFCLFLAELALA
jgi:hypothetical protein